MEKSTKTELVRIWLKQTGNTPDDAKSDAHRTANEIGALATLVNSLTNVKNLCGYESVSNHLLDKIGEGAISDQGLSDLVELASLMHSIEVNSSEIAVLADFLKELSATLKV